MKEYDISGEDFRYYVYEDGYQIRIDNPEKLFISESGTHRVSNNLLVTYVPNGWRKLCWKPKNMSKPVAF